MGKVKEFYMSLVEELEPTSYEEWVLVDHHLAASADTNVWKAEAEKLQRTVEGLGRQHEMEKAQIRAELEAELARTKADLARSELEKHELQTELFETQCYSGDLKYENIVLRHLLEVPPLKRGN